MGSRNDIRGRLQTQKESQYQTSHRYTACIDELFGIGLPFKCLVGVRERTLHKHLKEDQYQTRVIMVGDDSGSKLRDKEQQRLSSK